MKPIENPPPPSIGPQSTPDAVANLQDALLFLFEKGALGLSQLGDEAPMKLRREREQPIYGSVTAMIVAFVRNRLGLEGGEVVDEATAAALNRLLREQGAFEQAQPDWIVRGQVVDAAGPVDGVLISLWDRDLFFRRDQPGTGQHLGTATSGIPAGGPGQFELGFRTADFAAGDATTSEGPLPDLVFALNRDGRPLEGFHLVRLADGAAMQEDVPVSDDDMIIGIQPRRIEEVRIVLETGTAPRLASEYERLVEALGALLPEPRAGGDASARETQVAAMLVQLDEERHRDISFAAREIGVDRLLVDRLAGAARVARDPFGERIPLAIFYGLARTGLGASLDDIGRASSEELTRALDRAAGGEAPIIPPFVPPTKLAESVAALRDLVGQLLPSHQAADGAPTLAQLVGPALPAARDQATLWSRFTDQQGTAEDYWRNLAAQPGFDDETVAKAKFSFQLGALTKDRIALAEAIRANHPAAQSVSDIALALDSKKKWEALLDADGVVIPEDVPGKPEERKANYAASLFEAVQSAHPTAAVAGMTAALPATAFGGAQPAVAGFVAEAAGKLGFDFVHGQVNSLVAEHGDTLLAGVAPNDRAQVIAQVKRLQRLFRLSTGPETLEALVKAGFESAREIAELPEQDALDRLVPLIGDADARIVISRARNIAAAAIHQYMFLHDALQGAAIGGAL